MDSDTNGSLVHRHLFPVLAYREDNFFRYKGSSRVRFLRLYGVATYN